MPKYAEAKQIVFKDFHLDFFYIYYDFAKCVSYALLNRKEEKDKELLLAFLLNLCVLERSSTQIL